MVDVSAKTPTTSSCGRQDFVSMTTGQPLALVQRPNSIAKGGCACYRQELRPFKKVQNNARSINSFYASVLMLLKRWSNLRLTIVTRAKYSLRCKLVGNYKAVENGRHWLVFCSPRLPFFDMCKARLIQICSISDIKYSQEGGKTGWMEENRRIDNNSIFWPCCVETPWDRYRLDYELTRWENVADNKDKPRCSRRNHGPYSQAERIDCSWIKALTAVSGK